MALFVGIDAGSSALKVAAFNLNGQVVALAKRDLAIDFSRSPFVELDLEEYWLACLDCLGEILQGDPSLAGQVVSISVASQGSTFALVDKNGEPLGNAIFWMDSRAGKEAEQIQNSLGKTQIYRTTGQSSITPAHVPSKLLWLRRKECELLQHAAKLLFLQDFLVYKFTGKVVTDYSLASITSLLELNAKRWWKGLLDFIGVKESILPDLIEPGSRVGNLKPDLAHELGLRRGVAVCTGGLDQAASAIGAGNIRPGMLVENVGTVIALSTVLDEPFWDPNGRIPLLYHSIPDKYYLMLWSPNGGSILQWFREGLLASAIDLLHARSWPKGPDATRSGHLKPSDYNDVLDYDIIVDAAMSVAPGSGGLIMLPHLSGTGSPELNPKASGVFYGIRLGHDARHFARAALESTGYVLRSNMEELEKLGVRFQEVRSIGGGSKNPNWLQIKADIAQKPFLSMRVKEEAAALGACILAGVSLGYFGGYQEAVDGMVKIEKRIDPNSANASLYDEAFLKYKEIYNLLESSFEGTS